LPVSTDGRFAKSGSLPSQERAISAAYYLGRMERMSMPIRRYMVVEHFKNKDAVAVYRRFRDRGRMSPEGLFYISSWVDENLERCYQLMETADPRLLEEWMANWRDLVEFDVYPVITSTEAAEGIASLL
jgi:Protein of unknown function (DUF3303)